MTLASLRSSCRLGLSLLSLLVATASLTAQSAGNLAGTLVFNGAAIQGNGSSTLYVSMPGVSGTYVSTSGAYAFNTIAPGSYTPNVTDNGCSPSSALGQGGTFTVTGGGQTTTGNIDLSATAGRVQGTIYMNGSATTSNLSINGLCGQFQTASDGTFTHYLAPGSYTASVNNSSGGSLATFAFSVTAGQTTNVGNVSTSSGAMSGTVIWNGAAVSGTTVTTMLASIPNVGSGAVTSTGTFSISGIAPGAQTLTLYGNNCSPTVQFGTTSASVTSGQTTTANIDITAATGRVSGMIAVNGSVVTNPKISVSGACLQWQTLASGAFLQYLLPGSYTATVAATNATIGTFNFTVTAGQTTNVGTISFTTGNLSVIPSFNGAAISSPSLARMTAFITPGPAAGVALDPTQANFAFQNFSPGSYTVGIYQNNCAVAAGQLATFSTNIQGGSTTTSRPELASSAGLVTGTATVNGSALANPQISITNQCGTWASRSDGTYFQYLPPGTYTAQVAGPSGSTLGSFTFTVVAGQTTVANFGGASMAATTTTLSSSANPSMAGQAVTFTAAVSGTSPTGSVTFNDGSAQLATVQLSGGSAVYTTSSLALGNHSITAVYAGDANNATSMSSTLTQVVRTASVFPATAVGTSATPISVTFSIGTTVTLAAPSNSNVLTTGLPGLDFKLGTGSTCSGTVMAGQTCTVNVVFTPAAPGLRNGAVNLINSGGTIVATTYISGIGTGPLVDFSTSTASSVVTSGLSSPQHVVVDAAGNLYIPSNTYIAKANAGSAAASSYATSSQFSTLVELAIDGAGTLYATDYGAGKVFKVVGTSVSQLVTTTLSHPQGIVADAMGNVFFVDQGTNTLYEVAAGTSTPTVVIDSTGGLRAPTGLALDSAGGLYIADAGNGLIKHVAAGATTTTTVATPGFTLASPEGVAVDAAGNLYVNDLGNSRFLQVPVSGAAPFVLGTGVYDYFMSLDSAGRLYVSDQTHNQIVLFDRTLAKPIVFPSTAVNSTSAAQTVMLENDGNASLLVSVPASGVNPAITTPYVLGNSGTCPQVSSMGTPQPLASGASCTDVITFQPTSVSATNPGTLTTSDNSNNATSTQAVSLSGVATQAAQTITFPQPTTPAYVGGSATLTASASSGLTVTYSITSGPANLSGTTVNYTGAGTVVIAANQAGNTNYSAAPTVSDTVTVQTNPTTLALSAGPNPATPGATVTLTATLSATSVSGESVTFKNGATTLGTGPLTNGVATFTTSTLPTAVDNLTAVYAGDATYSASTSNTYSLVVGPIPGFIVNSTLDDNTGACTNQTVAGATADAKCELRKALAAVPNVSGNVQPTITFAPALNGQTINLTSGLSGYNNVAITGPGIANLTLVGPNTSTNIMSFYGASSNVTIAGLAFKTGSNGVYGNGSGMALTVNASSFTGFIQPPVSASISGGLLTVNNSLIYNNTGSSSVGQGVTVYNSSLSVNGDTFTNNTGTNGGAAVYFYGSATGTYLNIANSTFTGNMSGGGAAIYGYQTNQPVTITNSLFANNGVPNGTNYASGGAISMAASSVTISNSTFTGNYVHGGTNGNCGAIYVSSPANIFYNDTITGNFVVGTGDTQNGSTVTGTSNSSSGGVGGNNLQFFNTYVGGNGADKSPDSNGGTATSSIVGIGGTGASQYNYAFSPLANYGGPTSILLPLPGSPLLQAGSTGATGSAVTDQRGSQRVLNGKVDIGAAETNYMLAFAQQPTNAAAGSAITPSPSIQLVESGYPVAGSGASIVVTAATGTLSGITTQTTAATGIATYTGLSISSPQTSDTLTGTMKITSAATPVATVTSSAFMITGTTSQAITFPQPASPVLPGSTANLTATSSSGLGVAYTITSGSATLSGATVTYTGAGPVVIAANQAGNATYAAAPTVSVTVQVQNKPAIVWNPSSTIGYNGVYVGTGVLDATSTTPGSFAYTATPTAGSPVAITATSTLAIGSYTLTANFTPTDTTNNMSATATIAFAVVQQGIFVVNSGGSVTSVFDNGTSQSSAAAGGGRGAAVDGAGFVWSINSDGNGVSKFTDAGALSGNYTGSGTSSATGVAISGSGQVFVTNGDGTVNALTNTGASVFGMSIAGAAGVTTPTAISVDTAGSLWIASSGDNSAVEIIGVTAPVITPTVNAVKSAKPSTRP